jgi:hypothetical protein
VRQSVEVAVDFIRRTGVDCFAPAIGNAHGQYTSAPVLDHQRVSDLVEATGIPMALHGGTGLSKEQFQDLIARDCVKINISTALKEAYMKSGLEFLRDAEEKGKWDPPSLFRHQTAALTQMAREQAVLVVSELGDPDRPPIEVLANRCAARPGDYVTLGDLQECIRSGGGRRGGSEAGTGQERDTPGEGDLR